LCFLIPENEITIIPRIVKSPPINWIWLGSIPRKINEPNMMKKLRLVIMSVTFEASRYFRAEKVNMVPRNGPNKDPMKIYNIDSLL
jgi:hypothetical protein